MNLPLILFLARMCVAEAGFTENLEECRTMWHILDAKPGHLVRNVLKYTSHFRVPARRASRPYIMHLRLDPGLKPEGWDDSSASWENHIEPWTEILVAAVLFLEDPMDHPCPKANHYGGGMDTVPACWERQWCGKPHDFFKQSYWRSRDCTHTISARVASGE